jgi:hypothetical protein
LKFVEGMGTGTDADMRGLFAEEAAARRQSKAAPGDCPLQGVDDIQIPEAAKRMLLFKANGGLLQFKGSGIRDEKGFGAGGVKAHFALEQRPTAVRHEESEGTERVIQELAGQRGILDRAGVDKRDGNDGTAEGFNGSALKGNTALAVP